MNPRAPSRLEVSVEACRSIEDYARGGDGRERCGLLVGIRDGAVVRVLRATLGENVTTGDPRRGFVLDPGHLMAVDEQLRGGDELIVGVWHSHPSGAQGPSDRDHLEAHCAEWVYAIAAPGSDITWWVPGAAHGGQVLRGIDSQPWAGGS